MSNYNLSIYLSGEKLDGELSNSKQNKELAEYIANNLSLVLDAIPVQLSIKYPYKKYKDIKNVSLLGRTTFEKIKIIFSDGEAIDVLLSELINI